MRTRRELLDEIRVRVAAGARPDMRTSIDGLLMSKVTTGPAIPEYSLTAPLLVVMAQGGKNLLLGDRTYEYRAGQCLVVTANLPVTGHWIGTSEATPALALALVLRPSAIAALLLQTSAGRRPRAAVDASAMATGEASADLLDAVVRMLRLLDEPADAEVLAPLIEQEILWRFLTGPQGDTLRQIGRASCRERVSCCV